MVRTRGGSRYRPRVRFSTPEMKDPGTSGAAGAHSPDLPTETQPAQLPYLRSLRDSGDIIPEWDLRPLLRYLRDDAGGLDPPSGPRHHARGSLQDLGLSRHLPQLMRAHHSSYHRPRGLGAPCSPATRFRGT